MPNQTIPGTFEDFETSQTPQYQNDRAPGANGSSSSIRTENTPGANVRSLKENLSTPLSDNLKNDKPLSEITTNSDSVFRNRSERKNAEVPLSQSKLMNPHVVDRSAPITDSQEEQEGDKEFEHSKEHNPSQRYDVNENLKSRFAGGQSHSHVAALGKRFEDSTKSDEETSPSAPISAVRRGNILDRVKHFEDSPPRSQPRMQRSPGSLQSPFDPSKVIKKVKEPAEHYNESSSGSSNSETNTDKNARGDVGPLLSIGKGRGLFQALKERFTSEPEPSSSQVSASTQAPYKDSNNDSKLESEPVSRSKDGEFFSSEALKIDARVIKSKDDARVVSIKRPQVSSDADTLQESQPSVDEPTKERGIPKPRVTINEPSGESQYISEMHKDDYDKEDKFEEEDESEDESEEEEEDEEEEEENMEAARARQRQEYRKSMAAQTFNVDLFDIDDPDNTLTQVLLYLEHQTVEVINTIQSLLGAIKKPNATRGDLREKSKAITVVISQMTEATNTSMNQTRNAQLKEHGSWVVKSLEDCHHRMNILCKPGDRSDLEFADKNFKQRLAGISFDIAKCTKELVKTVEEASLKEDIAYLDARISHADDLT